MQSFFEKQLAALARIFKGAVRDVNIATSPAAVMPPSCHNINELLMHLCDYHEPTYMWVKRWLAFPLINPGARMAQALIVNGESGTGKSLFFEVVAAQLHGEHGRGIDERQLHSTFKLWAADITLVVVDGDLSNRNMTRLKSLITAESFPGTREPFDKRPAKPQRNQTNFVFCTNAHGFLPLDVGNRRFFVLEAPPAREARLYQAAAHDIEHGGIEVFREHLMTRLDMTGFNERTPPPPPAEASVCLKRFAV